jgi:hypothetical protein
MWVAIPALLVQAGLAKASHWQVYLPAVLASFLVMGAVLFPLERRGYLRAVFLGAVGLILLVQLGLLWWRRRSGAPAWQGCWRPAVPVFLRLQRARGHPAQPGLALAPAHARGAALGVYNTLQSLGFFAGGAVGGWITKNARRPGAFRGLRRPDAGLAAGGLAHAPGRLRSVTVGEEALAGRPVKL